ncbi:hypothetical protein LTR56_021602 [Elasticomyces elasticus]|nr:hypothetical protein LTR56_021602 [Elasticomyces elasticus]KAK3630955.1 hypothetical protein LTR22_021286 [Elasticomyces elasticus]KAK4915934.1 hypothetical protein LTR49_015969 [Elasticomyces elasticus]KAK5754041.1 hypothetical protein LTS12_015895 [Elasticomyces elasticus]
MLLGCQRDRRQWTAYGENAGMMDDFRGPINVNTGDLTTLGPFNTVNAGVFFNNREEGHEWLTWLPPQDSVTKLDKSRSNLFLTDPELDREGLISAKGKRVDGTCEWILDDAIFKSWCLGDTTSLLWINGGPGKGKTILSIYLTQTLRKPCTVYFFCSNDDQTRNNAAAVLRGLIWHITERCPQMAGQLVELHGNASSNRVQTTLGSREALWRILTRILQDPLNTTTCCVLDGLDECDENSQEWLVTKFTELLSVAPSSRNVGESVSAFKLLIVSRPGISGLARWEQIKLDPDNDELVEDDIWRFILSRVQELATKFEHEMSEELRGEIEQTLWDLAEGTFLWVGFAMFELLRKQTISDVVDTLHALPKGLPQFYARMLQQIAHKHRQTSMLILQWVTVAVRQLTLLELAVAIDIQSSKHITQKQAIRDQITACGPIVRVESGTVGLVHQSAKDYLLRGGVEVDLTLETLWVKVEEAHLTAALVCVKHLERVNALGQASRYRTKMSDEEVNSKLKRQPLDSYAIAYWPSHAKHSGTLVTCIFNHSRLFDEQSSFRNDWTDEYTRYDGRTYHIDCFPSLPAIHLACFLGIVPWIWRLIQSPRTGGSPVHRGRLGWLLTKTSRQQALQDSRHLVHVLDDDGHSPLWWAVYAGNEAVVQLLLASGASPNKSNPNDGRVRDILAIACERGYESIVRLLLEGGAAVNAQGGYYGNALQAACRNGDEAIVRLLLKTGAKVNEHGGEFDTALCAAAISGHEKLVQLLLTVGAAVNAPGMRLGSALLAAAVSGHETIVQLLLDNGADLHAQDKEHGNALQAASRSGHEAVVRLLLSKGADIDAQSEHDGSALQQASLRGQEAVVRLLIVEGASVQAQGGTYSNALQAASCNGHEAVVRLLLAEWANANMPGGRYGNALQAAALQGHEMIVRLLLAHGANVNAQGGQFRNALHAASFCRREAVVRLLLEHGAVEQFSGDEDAKEAQSRYETWLEKGVGHRDGE